LFTFAAGTEQERCSVVGPTTYFAQLASLADDAKTPGSTTVSTPTVDQPFRSGLALTWLWCEFGGVLWLWPLAAARPAISVSGHGETWRRCAAAALASARTGCATARASPGPPGSSAVRRQGSSAPGRAPGPLTSDCLPRRAAPPGPGTAECWTRSRVIRSRLHAHAPANGGLLSSRRGGGRVGLGDVRERKLRHSVPSRYGSLGPDTGDRSSIFDFQSHSALLVPQCNPAPCPSLVGAAARRDGALVVMPATEPRRWQLRAGVCELWAAGWCAHWRCSLALRPTLCRLPP
jgi:hypothetical protein